MFVERNIMKIFELTEDLMTESLLRKLHDTYHKYLNADFWMNKESLLRNLNWFKASLNENNLFVVTDMIDYIPLEIFREEFLPTEGYGFKYGVDYSDRFTFYNIDLWEKVSVLKELFTKLKMEHEDTFDVFYIEKQTPYDFRSFVKNLGNNYIPHIFGTKSKKLRLENIVGDTFENKYRILDSLLSACEVYGALRSKYLHTNDLLPLDTKMHSLVFNQHLNFHKNCGLTKFFDSETNVLLGVSTWSWIGNIGFWDEVILSMEDKYKSLSLYPIGAIHAVNNLFSREVDTVYLSFTIDRSLNEYKQFLKPKIKTFNFIKPTYIDFQQLKRDLLSIK